MTMSMVPQRRAVSNRDALRLAHAGLDEGTRHHERVSSLSDQLSALVDTAIFKPLTREEIIDGVLNLSIAFEDENDVHLRNILEMLREA